ncbi:MAG: transporter substrate-binding domain-containing protein, partial [Sedimentisphaerales bacterium]|nr:transporter substrate-binding domain-containing protein [Sedimentisphaerales bacterium]
MVYFLAQFIKIPDRIITAFLLVLISLCQSTLAVSNETAAILVINSYHFGYLWSDELTQGIRDKINAELPYANIYIEYMDSKHFDINYTDASFFELLKKKHSNYKFDVIITCDDDASYFVFRHYEQLYQGIPVVFCGVNQWQPELAYTSELRKEKITGMLQKSGFAETFELAKKINNEIDKVMIISDSQSTGLGFRQEAIDALSNNGSIKDFIDINGANFTTAQMFDAIINADDHTAIIYTIWFMGKEKIFHESFKVAERISQIAPVPVYATSDVNIKRGLLGGKITRGYTNGQAAAEMAIRILNGTSPKDIPIVTQGILEYAFNQGQLEKWNINKSILPEPYTIFDSNDTNTLFSDKEQRWLKSKQYITVAAVNDNPYMIDSDDPSGIAVDYLELISEITGLKVRYQKYDSINDYIEHLDQDNSADVYVMTPATTIYEEKLLLTKPWLKVNYSLFVDKQQNLMLYTGLNSIEGKTIAVLNDDVLVNELKANFPRVNVLYVNDYATGFKAVTAGNVYGFLIDHSTGVYQANTLHVEQNVTVAPVYDLPGRNIAIGVSRLMPEL